ncbi:hypothetical protein AABB24_026150 [Solanum stoloniferum]|uniref:Retrovirus-related Pol polyprotein from transposon TNT 1-94-like beta-barrel domain-containing protein n=1 Tax=Solanum stoloniferum TaxID=62892 RepID=A0ABD2SDP5_9SOLN
MSLEQFAQVQRMFPKSTTLIPSVNMAGNPCILEGDKDTHDWIVDTGATNHMVCHPSMLSDIKKCRGIGDVHLPDGRTLSILHVGNCRLGQGKIRNVLCVPGFKLNLPENLIVS